MAYWYVDHTVLDTQHSIPREMRTVWDLCFDKSLNEWLPLNCAHHFSRKQQFTIDQDKMFVYFVYMAEMSSKKNQTQTNGKRY